MHNSDEKVSAQETSEESHDRSLGQVQLDVRKKKNYTKLLSELYVGEDFTADGEEWHKELQRL